MIGDLLACLNIYKSCILGGNIPLDYLERSKKVLEEISILENLVQTRQILNSYNFKGLKRDVSFVFHPDHFPNISSVIKDSEKVLANFLGTIDKINDAIKSGCTIEPQQRTNYSHQSSYQGQSRYNPNYNQQNPGYNPGFNYQRSRNNADTQRRQYAYEDIYDNNDRPTIFNYVSDRFNAIFRNIPSNEEEYSSILNKKCQKLNKLNNALRDLIVDIDVLKGKKRSNIIARNNAINARTISNEYNSYCDSLYDSLCIQDDIKRRRNAALSARFDQLSPIIDLQEQEWFNRYNDLVSEHQQLCREYQISVMDNNTRKAKVLSKRLDEVNTELASCVKVLEEGVRNVITRKIIKEDSAYQELLNMYKEATAKLGNIDRRYRFVIDHPQVVMDEIRSTLEQEYSKLDIKYSEDLLKLENKKKELDAEIRRLEDEVFEFKAKYSRFAPKTKRK